MATDDNKKEIELRSEKVRNIVGQIPPLLLRKGILIISLVLLMVLIGANFIPYPETVKVPVEIMCFPNNEVISSPDKGIVHFLFAKNPVKQHEIVAKIEFSKGKDSVIYSLIAGDLFKLCKDNTIVEQGKEICSISPSRIEKIYGEAYVSIQQKNKLKIGQIIHLKLPENFTEMYGLEEGYISAIYPIPDPNISDQDMYKIEIQLPNGLTTPNGDVIKLFLPIRGTATIQLSNESVLKRFIKSMMRK